jgi:hypothetical protein
MTFVTSPHRCCGVGVMDRHQLCTGLSDSSEPRSTPALLIRRTKNGRIDSPSELVVSPEVQVVEFLPLNRVPLCLILSV